ncbi:MAG: hypothetical protein EXR51_02550 [Dehalococcoidia bacterium]|nr:hypothetical protein [Dehalococcoidia bacterium]
MRAFVPLLLISALIFSIVPGASPGAPASAESIARVMAPQPTALVPGEPTLLPAPGSLVAPSAGSPPQSRLISLKFRGGSHPLAMERLNGLFGSTLVRYNDLTGVHTIQTPHGSAPESLARQFSARSEVAWAETVKWRRVSDSPRAPLTPTDTRYATNQSSYYKVIGAPDAWGIETGSASIVIAVVDSGVMCSHKDLATNIWANPKEVPGNGIDDDQNGYIDDVNGNDFVGAENGADESPTADLPGDGDPCVKAGDPAAGNGTDDDQNGQADAGVYHGTFVAGIAAAVTNNAEGVAGMCWRCKIMPIRVANPEGWVRSSDTADGITYAARNGARIINVSLGGSELSQAEKAAVDAAINTLKVVVVAAAGNENHNPISFPAQLPNVIAVGAAARVNTKGRASFSNWGTGTPGNRVVDIVAPGESLASTAVYSVADQNSGRGAAGTGTYLAGSGTSFSTPLVAGLVGLILSRNPGLTPAQVQTTLKQTATPLGDDPGDSPDAGPNWAGPGLVNALAALNAVPAANPSPTPAPSPSVSPTAATTPTPQPTTTTATPIASATAPATPAACPTAPPVGSPTAAPSGTPATTPTPLPAGATPQARVPDCGVEITGLGTTLGWNAAAGATQFQVQVIPANNDGPAINLIRNAATSYVIDPPVFGTGPYVMLPQITYSWRVRTTTASTGIDENSPLWGPWSPMSSFKTRKASSDTITLTAPVEGARVAGFTPVLQWANTDTGVFYYEVQLSKDSNFGEKGAVAMVYSELRHGAVSTPVNSYAVPAGFPLEPSTAYVWRVRPRIQGDGVPVAWSKLFSFKTP